MIREIGTRDSSAGVPGVNLAPAAFQIVLDAAAERAIQERENRLHAGTVVGDADFRVLGHQGGVKPLGQIRREQRRVTSQRASSA